MINKKLFLSTILLGFCSSVLIAKADESQLNIILNTTQETLFSSNLNGGKEFGAFVGSMEEVKNLVIKNNKFHVFVADGNYLILPSGINLKNINTPKLNFKFLKKTFLWQGDRNDFILDPEETSNDILNLSLQRHKIFFPYTKAKIIDKKLFELNEDGVVKGYLILSSDFLESKILTYIGDPANWESKATLSFTTSFQSKSYDVIMLNNDPYHSLRTQQALSNIIKNLPKKNTIRLSYGNLFGDDKKKRDIELKNLKENKPDIILPSFTDLTLSNKEIESVNEIAPFVATNLVYEGKDLFKPYIIKNINDKNIAFLGIVDDFYPKAIGTVNKSSKLKFIETNDILPNNLKKLLNDSKVDMIVIMTNITSSKEKLDNIKKIVSSSVNDYPQKQVLFFSLNKDDSYFSRSKNYEQNFKFEDPQLYINTPLSDGIYSINLNLKDNYVSNLKINSKKLQQDNQLDEKMKKLNDEIVMETERIINSLSDKDFIIPDLRDLSNHIEKNKIKVKLTDEVAYKQDSKSTIAGNALLESFNAEVSIVKNDYGNLDTIGKISKTSFKDYYWFESRNEKLVFLNLSGKELKNLSNIDNNIKLFESTGTLKFYGINFEKNLIRGRIINDSEYYKVVTTEDIYNNLLLDPVFKNATAVEIKTIDFKESVYNYLVTLTKKHAVDTKGFTDAYYNDFVKLFEDKSSILMGKWYLSLKNFDVNYNKGEVFNNEKLTQIKDSRINTPNSFDIGFNSKIESIFDNKDFSFGNALFGTFAKSFINLKNGNEITNVEKKAKDDLNISTDLQLKFISLSLSDAKISVVPFVNETYSTEFLPTKNQETNKDNLRRSELNSSTGLVLYPYFIDEIRVGFISRYDFTIPNSGWLNPGWFTSFNSTFNLSNIAYLTLDGNYKNYFQTPNESIEQLSSYGEINAKVSIPIADRFKVSFNINTFLFQGNQNLRTLGYGYGLSGYAGLNYSFDTKPEYFIYF